MEQTTLYDADQIDLLQWPTTPNGEYAKKFLTPFIKEGPGYYIDNIQTKMLALKCGESILPITVNEKEYDNSYVCSIYAQYINCGIETTKNYCNPILSKALKLCLNTLGFMFKTCQIDKIVAVNNWLFPTNLYPPLTHAQITSIKSTLLKKYPEHTILFRSLVPELNKELLEALKKEGFLLLASRPVFLQDPQDGQVDKARMFKSDLKLLQKSDYSVHKENSEHPKYSETAPDRLKELYRKLYLDKHSKHSPQFNSRFMELVIANKILHLITLHKDERIDAVVGYFCRDQVITSPLFGYDTDIPQTEGLYRQMSALLTLEAKEKKCFLHNSAGAASFKKLRHSKQAIEYFAVYVDHLPVQRRLPWHVLRVVANKIGVPFMKYYNL